MIGLHCMIVDIADVLQIQKKVDGKNHWNLCHNHICASAELLVAPFTCIHLALSGRIQGVLSH